MRLTAIATSVCSLLCVVSPTVNAANPDHVKQLLETNECERCDLRQADLQGANLRKARLGGATLVGANLQGANLRGAILNEANLQGANLRDADLRGTNLVSSNLRLAQLQNIRFNRHTKFHNSNLKQTQLPAWLWSDTVDHPWKHCFWKLGQQNIFSGYPDGTFRPQRPVTRAEFAAIVRSAFPDAATVREATPFRDVSANYWAADAIREANRTGFLSGYPRNSFRPNLQIPRVQVLVAIASGLGLEIPNGSDRFLRTLTDALPDGHTDAIPNYATGKIAAALQKQLVVLPPGDPFLPNEPATRAEVAASVCQARRKPGEIEEIQLRYVFQVPPEPSAPAKSWEDAPLRHRLDVQDATLALSNDGRTLATYFQQGQQVRLWDTETGEEQRTIAVSENTEILTAAVSPNGNTIATLTRSQNQPSLAVQIWDAQTGENLRSLSPLELPHNDANDNTELHINLTYSPNGEFLATSVSSSEKNSNPQAIQLWDVETGNLVRSLQTSHHPIRKMVFAPNSTLLAAVTSDNKVQLWNVETGKQEWVLTDAYKVRSFLDFRADSEMLLVMVDFGRTHGIRLWDVRTGELHHTFGGPFDRTLSMYALSFEAQKVFGGSYVVGEELIDFWRRSIYELADFQEPGGKDHIRDAIFSADGTSLVVSTSEALYIY
ncbi:S-layer homology domain-containing protein [Geitlerinema sp. PCC 9228]|uniref:S-layer homology domain-containing protein n=1 Tax=Geitlerinema sp. PCC 9228 TaxID=111611 RepID=UPI0009FC534C|nr:S-layer homology domain-containing protein [Geitlerinema sp. PCC 9228]